MKFDVIGKLVTLSEHEAEQLRDAAAADGRSSARRDLSLLLERGLRTKRAPGRVQSWGKDVKDSVLAGNGPPGGVPGEACRGGSL